MKFAILGAVLLFPIASYADATIKTSPLHLEDAENFAKLISNNQIPDEATLQKEYLDKGSIGVSIFTPYRIVDAKKLHSQIEKNIEKYRYATNECLPILRGMEKDINITLQKTSKIVGEKEIAPAYILYGADNSGGTADTRGLAIGLEVVCNGKTKDNFKPFIGYMISHEITHVYQSKHQPDEIEYSLLYHAIMEGSADFVADLTMGNATSTKQPYGIYGAANEREIWLDFKNDLKNNPKDSKDWFYQPGRNGRPNDLGYFIGRRICEEYYKRAKNKKQAIRDLLYNKNPQEILEKSQYGKNWD